MNFSRNGLRMPCFFFLSPSNHSSLDFWQLSNRATSMKLDMQLHNNITQRGFSRNPWKKLPSGGPCLPASPPSKKSSSSFIVRLWWNLDIFICLPIIIEIEIYEWGPFTPRRLFPPPLSKKSNSYFIVRFWWNLKNNIFICLPIERSPTQPYKRGQLPQECCISYSRVGHFRHLFLHCSHT